MRQRVSTIGWLMIGALLLGGCDDEQRVTERDTNGGDEAIAIAWAFVKARNWQEAATSDGRHAEVNRVVVNDDYELMDDALLGDEALAVTFEAAANGTVGVPIVLVEPKTNRVVGYMPSE